MITEELSRRILILDGATGTMLQKGYSIEQVHDLYIEAGADIITANTFNLKGYRDTFEFTSIARRCADKSLRKVYVALDLGPYSLMLSLSEDALHPESRKTSFDELSAIYKENARAGLDAGADLVLIETAFDGLNVKAALYALDTLFEETGRRLPVMLSATINDRSGRLLTGMTLEALYRSVSHFPLLSFGLNCSFGAEDMAPCIRQISSFAATAVSMHPNAGLPNQMGGYDSTPAQMASVIRSLAMEGCLNIAGGCCGTTPQHIKALREALDGVAPRRIPSFDDDSLWSCGLQPVRVDLKSTNFVNVGERNNVAGSRKFARLIAEKNYEEAAAISVKQIEEGASIIDINMDDAMLDSRAEMEHFVRYISNDPDISRAAFMIDSSDWDTVLAGVKNCQGRCIVNSLSLKEGEELFLRRAREIHRLGAALIVMAFDEQGQATTFQRKTDICQRAYDLLISKAGFAPQDIIFDVNILTVGTGMAEHADYAADFIKAVRWIKDNLPGCHTSGGVSNLSFAFRGNNPVREAMHSVFLYHAIEAGLDMAIVNPGMLQIYSQIEPSLRKAAEDVVLNSDADATERLSALASSLKVSASSSDAPNEEKWRELPVEERLAYSVQRGLTQYLEEDISQMLPHKAPVAIIEGPLLKGMEDVGRLFGAGEMFLPQVIKSAKAMRSAVEILKPYMNSGEGHTSRSRMVLATAQGDVHDIGKNILSIVLSCNDIEVIDLGVMVPNEEIVAAVRKYNPDFVGVSGLITPSLGYMEQLCEAFSKEGFTKPLFIGGATTSALHTAVKLSPLYENVIYTSSASDCANTLNRLIADFDAEMARIVSEREALRLRYEGRNESYVSLEEASSRAPRYDIHSFLQPEGYGEKDFYEKNIELASFVGMIDWTMFLSFWGFRGKDAVSVNPEAEKCYEDGLETFSRMLIMKDVEVSAVLKFFDACADGESIFLPENGCHIEVPRSTSTLTSFESLADFFPPFESGVTSRIALFAIKVLDKSSNCCGEDCKDYDHLMRRSMCQRIAEAASYWLQKQVAPDINTIRPAFGYPSCPDHSLKAKVFELLDAQQKIGVRLTESYAMIPSTSICGMIIAHPEAHYPNIRISQ